MWVYVGVTRKVREESLEKCHENKSLHSDFREVCVCVRMCVCVCVSLEKCHKNSHWTQSLAARRPPRSVCVCSSVCVCVTPNIRRAWEVKILKTRLQSRFHTLQHDATHCNKLQCTATHCNALLKTRLQSRFASSSYADGTPVARRWQDAFYERTF